MRPSFVLGMFLSMLSVFAGHAQTDSLIVNDITQLNPIRVDRVLVPVSTSEICEAVKSHAGPVSIGGGRYSMGGQTATESALFIDMRDFDSIVSFSAKDRLITVQAGITWREVQEFIDPHDLSVSIMQTYANFTVGGSLSVNVHGRYIGQGPIVLSVKQIRLVLADGSLVTAGPEENSKLFYGAIGGYGGLGVITEATLQLAENCRVERTDRVMRAEAYAAFFNEQVLPDSAVVFHNADFYPRRYRKVRAVTYTRTDKPVTVEERLKPENGRYRSHKAVYRMIAGFPGGKWIRQHVVDPIVYRKSPVEWRNFEASYDVRELEPRTRKRKTYVLQEYFVPVEAFREFYPQLTEILRREHVNVINISIRHARKDPGSLMAWARTDVFAFVIYYRQGTRPKAQAHVKEWTQQLIDAAIAHKGTYYLPYQIHATPEQFGKAYPQAETFFEVKREVDPGNKFRNKLWDSYFTGEGRQGM